MVFKDWTSQIHYLHPLTTNRIYPIRVQLVQISSRNCMKAVFSYIHKMLDLAPSDLPAPKEVTQVSTIQAIWKAQNRLKWQWNINVSKYQKNIWYINFCFTSLYYPSTFSVLYIISILWLYYKNKFSSMTTIQKIKTIKLSGS